MEAYKCDACGNYYDEKIVDPEYWVVRSTDVDEKPDLCSSCYDKVHALFKNTPDKPKHKIAYGWSDAKKKKMQKIREGARDLQKEHKLPFYKAMSFASRQMKGEDVSLEIEEAERELAAPSLKLKKSKKVKQILCVMCSEIEVNQKGDMCEECESKYERVNP